MCQSNILGLFAVSTPRGSTTTELPLPNGTQITISLDQEARPNILGELFPKDRQDFTPLSAERLAEIEAEVDVMFPD
jgi:hypothetical protein